MPWKKLSPMDEKMRFVQLARSGRFHICELCADFGISRKTGHKYLERFARLGSEGLADRSRRPRSSPNATVEAVERLVLKEKRLHPNWGPKKIQRLLETRHGVERPPATSTVGEILKRHGLVKSRRRRHPGAYRLANDQLTVPLQPNDVWTVDYKGWFLLGNGQRCDPLTVCDLYSRYLLACKARPNQQHAGTLRAFKPIMRLHGLPRVIRVDNGSPFASGGIGGLSRLSVWWIEQGVAVEFIRPGKPQDNGSHERMHQDLKAEATRPPSPNMAAQQRRFQRWAKERNELRPHEELDMRTPAEVYRRSQRRLGENDRIRYPDDHLECRIQPNGHLLFEGESYFVGEALALCRVGLFLNDKGVVELHYANIHLGNLAFGKEGRFRPTAYIAPPCP